MKKYLFVTFVAFIALTNCKAQKSNDVYKFDFGNGKTADGYVQVTPEKKYKPSSKDSLVYGFIYKDIIVATQKGKDPLTGDFIVSEAPFYFAINLPEGNYKVTVTLGDPKGISNTIVKAESRRLMLYNLSTRAGEVVKKSFVVSVRSARINEDDSIRLKPREFEYLNWDNKLSLEFGGERPCVSSLTIEKVDHVKTIFLTGNSTVVDQDREPWASWGQMFPCFFNDQVVIANYAESGETLKAFVREKRLEKISTQIKEGDYLFMEFAHNDQKPGGNHVDAFGDYQEYLMKFVTLAREKGATPVFVTSTNRRKFDDNGKIENTLEDYPEAMRQLAAKEGITLIDLNAMSKLFYEALGVEESKKAFVHYPANTFPGQTEALADNTHFNTYGAYELAKCVVDALKKTDIELVNFLKGNFKSFDPSKPDSVEGWKWPLSPAFSDLKPDGN